MVLNPSGLEETGGLKRRLGLFDSVMVQVGIIIGSGVFLTTGIMARSLPSPSLILLAWLVGGLLTLAGALTYAELGAAMPKAGGQYVYLREAFGPLAGFLFGWILFLVYMTGGIAALALAFAEYFGSLFPGLDVNRVLLGLTLPVGRGLRYSLSAGQLVAVGAIAFFSLLNALGVWLGKTVQNGLTVFKIGILAALVGMGFLFGKGQPPSLAIGTSSPGFTALLTGFGVSLVAVAWAFDGWNNVNFVAGEIKNPGRNLPRALMIGTLGVTVLYLLVNYLYLYALPMDEMAGVVRIAEKATGALFGRSTGLWISAAVVISTLGSINGSILAGPRVYYAMSRDGLFFRKAGAVHPRFQTPAASIVVQGIWASVLTIAGTFEQIFTFAMFTSILFWVAGAASVFVLRRKAPDLERPYKTWGYPVVPAIFILCSLGILLNTLLEKPVESLAGLGLLALGFPVYYYWRTKGRKFHE
ncbi:MAG: amino acid permease [Acidobacteriota bacterium]